MAVVAYAVDFAVSSDRVPRGVTVAGVEIGGQNDQDAEATCGPHSDPVWANRLPVRAGTTDSSIVPGAGRV